MTKERIFTDQELEAMGARTLDVLQAAIESGDLDMAGRLAFRMYAEFSAMHDLYRDWLTDVLSLIGRRFGDRALSEILEDSVRNFTNRFNDRYEGKSLRRRIQILMAGLRGHLQPMKIEEDDEKFVITPTPCGSGGRQVQDGLYEGPEGFLKVKGPHAWTFDRPDFPVYCAHCYFQNQFPLVPGEDVSGELVPSEDLGQEPCKSFIYKK